MLAAMLLAAVAQDSSQRPAPPGPYRKSELAEKNADHGFTSSQPLLGTYYFYWYDDASGAHFVDPDGSDALTRHPARRDGYSWKSVEWHERELRDMVAAGLDFALPVYWGAPGAAGEDWCDEGLRRLVEAARRVPDAPRIGMFYDTTTLRWNRKGFHADLTTRAGKEWLYLTVRDFYSLVPPELRACIGGRPIVWLYSAGWAKAQDAAALDWLHREFELDFGTAPFVVKETSWLGRADAAYQWGAALAPTLFEVAAVGPGYDHSAVEGRAPLVRAREGGDFYRRSWEWILCRAPERRPRLAIVETWNEWHEGTDIADSAEDGRAYIDLTRQYADLWHARALLPPAGPFGAAREVSIVLGLHNEERGVSQRDHADGLTQPLAEGRATAPNPSNGRYIYFDVDNAFYWNDGVPLEVEVEFLDRPGADFALQYDSTDPGATLGGSFKDAGRVDAPGSGQWKRATLRLPDPAFTGRANGFDFRLQDLGGALAVRTVRVRK